MDQSNWRMPEPRRAEIINHLAGEHSLEPGWSAKDHPPAITEPGGGGKFDPDGAVLPYPGNTFLCHIDRRSDFFSALCDMQDDLKTMHFADHFAFLPKPSFHMTIFCGISGSPLGQDGWPDGFERDVSLEAVTSAYRDRLRGETGEDGFSMVATGLSLPATIEMEPATAADAEALRKVRHKLQKLTGIYRPDFETYRFHVSMAYLTRWLAIAEAEFVMREAEKLFAKYVQGQREVQLGPVEFCEFETMHRFTAVGILGAHGFAPAR